MLFSLFPFFTRFLSNNDGGSYVDLAQDSGKNSTRNWKFELTECFHCDGLYVEKNSILAVRHLTARIMTSKVKLISKFVN